MLNMENAEEVMQILERFTRLKQKEIPKELDDYMNYVAKTGDTVFKWSSLKYLFREKLLNVIKNFHDTSPRVDDLPQYPNVDPFNYESMKSSLLERLELFNAAPFTIQRLCELLTEPRKQYSRIDKFMRALEKNILVSTIEPGRKRTESENGDSLDSVVNGDASLDVNVDIDMENEPIFNAEPPNATSSTSPSSQPSSNLIHKADDDILPNPKKPKLDLDETNDAETEAATKSIASDKTDTAEHSVEKVIADESADITDNKKKEERVAEESTVSEEKPSDVNATVTAEIAVVADANKDVKDSECEKMEEDSPAAAAPATENNNVDDKKDEAESKAEEKVEAITTSKPAEVVEVDKVSPLTSTSEVVAAVEAVKTTENPQKIDDAPAPEGIKKDCAEKVTEKQETAKDIEAEKVIKENDDDKENHNGDIKENKEKTEITITTTNSEKIDDTKADSAPEKTIAANKEEKSEEVLKEKTEEVVVASAAVVVEGSKKEVAEALKTGVIPSVVAEEPSQPEEAKPAGEAVTAAEAVSVPVEEIKETNAEQVAKIVTADPPPPATESLQKESSETPAEIKPSEPKESEAEKAAEIPATTAAPPTESKDVAITIPVPVVVAAEPVVTADQPMEENPESIAEAEPVVPTIVVEAAANVEEVEMATDVIEPAKDEPAGMEVDDTSQEAMDQ